MKREHVFADYCSDAVRTLTELRSDAEKAMINAGQIDVVDESEAEPFQWISLQHPEVPVLTYRPKVQDATAAPYQRIAGLVELLQGNLPPEALQMQGLTTLIRGNRVHFCISGSLSLESLQTLCAHDQATPDHPRQK